MIRYYTYSQRGGRSTNQDRFTCLRMNAQSSKEVWFFAVSDGMGGLSDGAQYAELTLCSIQKYAAEAMFYAQQRLADEVFSDFDDTLAEYIESTGRTLLTRINDEVLSNATAAGLGRGGATLSACFIVGSMLICINSGDSPIYRLAEYGSEELGVRDNAAEYMVRKGIIKRDSEEYRKNSNALMSFIGHTGEGRFHIKKYELETGDILIIGSDGAFGGIHTAAQLEETVSRDCKTSELCRRLFSASAQTTDDNQTAIVIHYCEEDAPVRRLLSVMRSKYEKQRRSLSERARRIQMVLKMVISRRREHRRHSGDL